MLLEALNLSAALNLKRDFGLSGKVFLSCTAKSKTKIYEAMLKSTTETFG